MHNNVYVHNCIISLLFTSCKSIVFIEILADYNGWFVTVCSGKLIQPGPYPVRASNSCVVQKIQQCSYICNVQSELLVQVIKLLLINPSHMEVAVTIQGDGFIQGTTIFILQYILVFFWFTHHVSLIPTIHFCTACVLNSMPTLSIFVASYHSFLVPRVCRAAYVPTYRVFLLPVFLVSVYYYRGAVT